MNEQNLWMTLGERLNAEGIYYEDVIGHLATLNSNENDFNSEEEFETAILSSVNFISKFEAIMARIIIEEGGK